MEAVAGRVWGNAAVMVGSFKDVRCELTRRHAVVEIAGNGGGDLRDGARFGMMRNASVLPARGSLVGRNVAGETMRDYQDLYEGIANFYDSSSTVWEDIWGEHMHHGYYDTQEDKSADHLHAQIRMIEKSLEWAGIPDDEESKPRIIADIGCGIGGSARYLARKYGGNVQGISLSPVQVQRATSLTASAKLANFVNFQVANAMQQPFADGQFDLVWSMESGEHMPDKKKFMQELTRVTAPNGRILVVTWCHRDLKPTETSLKPDEEELLKKVCDVYYLPKWCSGADYVEIAKSLGLKYHSLFIETLKIYLKRLFSRKLSERDWKIQLPRLRVAFEKDVRSADWSQYVTPFWPAVVASALTWKGLIGLAKSGWTTIKGALGMSLMVQGYSRGLIKFVVISAVKE